MAVSTNNSDESFDKLKKLEYGIDSPAGAPGKDQHKNLANNKALDGNPVKRTESKDAKFAEGKSVPNGTGPKALETSRSKNATKADLPTTASAKPGLDLAKQIAQVDPTGKAQAFANMVKQFAAVKSIMNIANAAPAGAPLTTTQANVVTDALSEALCILCKKYSYKTVVQILDNVFQNNSFYQISSIYQDTVKGAISKLLEKAIIFGETNIPVKPTPPVVYGTKVPPSNLLLADISLVPSFAIKQYYTADNDPYRGYIEYIKEDQTKVYIKRTSKDYPYTSVDDECLALAEKGIAEDLDIYFKYPEYYLNAQAIDITKFKLTPTILNTILDKHKILHANNGMDLAVGKNSSSSLMTNLPALLGAAGVAVNLAKGNFLPKSVLDTGKVSKSLEGFSKNMAMLTVMNNKSKTAFKPPGLPGLQIPGLASLAAVAGLAGTLSNLGISIPSLIPSLGGISAVTNLTSSLGSIGGLTSALGSVNGLSSVLQSAGMTIPSIASLAVGATASRSNISNALKIAGVTSVAVVATSNLLKNMGV
jgi:hypothetical protein